MTPLAAIAERLRARLGLDPAALGARALGHAVRGRAKARGLDGPAAYLAALADDAAEWDALIDAVVVPETWFFRDREPFALLARCAARQWSTRDAHDPVAILSLPCATGEEAWSIAIALAASGVPPAAFRVDALDVSARALEIARTARYPTRALRRQCLEPAWAQYLDGAAGPEQSRRTPSAPARRGGGLEGAAPSALGRRGTGPSESLHVAPALRASVRFARGNLLDARRDLAGRHFDCIFSRNLLIYCDAPTRAAAIATFTDLLRPEGLLVLGHAETLPPNTAGFVRERPSAAFAWRRIAARRVPTRRAPAPRDARGQAGRDCEDARGLADRGKLAEAAAAAAAQIERAPADASAHALLGVVCAAQGRDAEAIEHLRRALYLEPGNEDALAHLAVILERRGDRAAAARLRQRARRQEAAK